MFIAYPGLKTGAVELLLPPQVINYQPLPLPVRAAPLDEIDSILIQGGVYEYQGRIKSVTGKPERTVHRRPPYPTGYGLSGEYSIPGWAKLKFPGHGEYPLLTFLVHTHILKKGVNFTAGEHHPPW